MDSICDQPGCDIPAFSLYRFCELHLEEMGHTICIGAECDRLVGVSYWGERKKEDDSFFCRACQDPEADVPFKSICKVCKKTIHSGYHYEQRENALHCDGVCYPCYFKKCKVKNCKRLKVDESGLCYDHLWRNQEDDIELRRFLKARKKYQDLHWKLTRINLQRDERGEQRLNLAKPKRRCSLGPCKGDSVEDDFYCQNCKKQKTN